MDSKQDNAPAKPPEPEVARHIDELMAQPIKARPAVTILGDDDVVGFNPPKAAGGRG